MSLLLKVFVYFFIFSVLHFAFDLTGWSLLKPFCGVDESVFQHLKMAFWAYLLASFVEYLSNKKRREVDRIFWYSRFLAATFVPWIIFLIYFLGLAIVGKFPASYLELIWAISVSFFSGLTGGMIEKQLGGQKMAFAFRALIIFLFLSSAFLYVIFTYRLPWLDMFRPPE